MPRVRLINTLESGIPHHKLLLLSAPAGYGKTTLLLQWANSSRVSIVWLSLGEEDNDLPGFSWIDLPVLEDGEPNHQRGVVANEPGLYFVGLHFLDALSSTMVHGVSRDAGRIAQAITSQGQKVGCVDQQDVDELCLWKKSIE